MAKEKGESNTTLIIMKKTTIKNFLFIALSATALAACSSDGGNDGGNGGSSSSANTNKNTSFSDKAATRVEVPHLQGGNSQFIVYRTTDTGFDKDGVNYCVEWDKDLKANRWACYILTKSNINGNGQRWSGDRYVSQTSTAAAYFFDTKNLSLEDYYYRTENGSYSDYLYRSGFDHGHLCNSNDRTYNSASKTAVGEINKQTFYLTNMQPQYSVFNGSSREHQYKGLWLTMENFVHNFVATGSKFGANDTLFVCKGGTIDSEDQILKRIDNKLIVPKYYYAAVAWKRTSLNVYSGIAFWFEHTNVYHGDDSLKGYAISIDELEKKLGGKIDFFCNLPDETENAVEKTAATMDFGL